ncbi:hypothetical protein PtA15_7A194 [Puccinia triticina]|uniref:Uncharacterized protein n=1 Tax=Puccinia triticina TaxID=208348 RepID=A0ABY7CML2_9BASI|nr:uncharacterized protein PtA15_7A194 [Puccinia triticina]WAQ86468.1 hypothetical protein PtA15_7A194 [Puccinia triticina]
MFYWLGKPFNTNLLVQSFFMIIALFSLLWPTLSGNPYNDHYHLSETVFQPSGGPKLLRSRSPPTQAAPTPCSAPSLVVVRLETLSFDYYVDFFALLFAVQATLFILFQCYNWFIQAIGFL